MDDTKLIRSQYTAQLSLPADELTHVFDECRQIALQLIKSGRIMTAAAYNYSRSLFLYIESIGEEINPNELTQPLLKYLNPYPMGDMSTEWAKMQPVFWHCEPKSAQDWRIGRPRERRRGRIAYLVPEKANEYLYHHIALTREGVFKGDKYMFISLLGNLLFSYFEEPRSSENISGTDENSKAIGEWMKTNPDSHFIRLPESQGQNFLLLPSVFDAGESDI